jgi:hypothetical protein
MRAHFHSATVSEFSFRQFRRLLWRTCIRIFASESSRLQIYDWIAIMRMTQSNDPKSKHYKGILRAWLTRGKLCCVRPIVWETFGACKNLSETRWSAYNMMSIFPSVMEVRQALFKVKYSELACSIFLLKAYTIVYSIYMVVSGCVYLLFASN